MVKVFVENTFLAAEVVFDGDAEGLKEIYDGLLFDHDPRLSLLHADCLSRNLWHDIYEI